MIDEGLLLKMEEWVYVAMPRLDVVMSLVSIKTNSIVVSWTLPVYQWGKIPWTSYQYPYMACCPTISVWLYASPEQ